MTGLYAAPQPCPVCWRGTYSRPESLRVHTYSAHAYLSDRERADVIELATLTDRGAKAHSGHDLSLTYDRPIDCPKCNRGPFAWPLSLWVHAYVWHGYLSLRELADLMDTALWRGSGRHER